MRVGIIAQRSEMDIISSVEKASNLMLLFTLPPSPVAQRYHLEWMSRTFGALQRHGVHVDQQVLIILNISSEMRNIFLVWTVSEAP